MRFAIVFSAFFFVVTVSFAADCAQFCSGQLNANCPCLPGFQLENTTCYNKCLQKCAESPNCPNNSDKKCCFTTTQWKNNHCQAQCNLLN